MKNLGQAIEEEPNNEVVDTYSNKHKDEGKLLVRGLHGVTKTLQAAGVSGMDYY